jgi:hypothetical protein
MSTYTKEKNIITINLDGASGAYRLDINTGIFYGVKGNPVKTFSRRQEVVRMLPYYSTNGGSNLEYVLYRMFDNCSATREYRQYASALSTADRLDAIGVPRLSVSRNEMAEIGESFKEFAEYIKTIEIGNFRMSQFRGWRDAEKARKALKALGSIADGLTEEMYLLLIDRKPDITKEEIGVCAYYLGRGKYWEYHGGDCRKLFAYLAMCSDMEKKPEKVNNFMREYCETRNTWLLRKEEFDNKKLVASYAKHAKAWEFSYGNYIVSIPSCGQDIVTEGQRMHHCVGSYVDMVVRGETFICFIRHKDKPNEPYITCQVKTDGDINQYFLAYDRYISSTDDLAFKRAFQKYLREVWGN